MFNPTISQSITGLIGVYIDDDDDDDHDDPNDHDDHDGDHDIAKAGKMSHDCINDNIKIIINDITLRMIVNYL